MRPITSILKNGIIYSFVSGFCCGLVPNKIRIHYNSIHYNNLPLPFIGGCVGVAGFVCSPFLIYNYFFEGVYFDKLVDNYQYSIDRYHQYDGTNNKYAYPSTFVVTIINNKYYRNP
jgi:hypothetical protein